MKLSEDHISYIVKDLNYRGIVVEGIQEELIDHVCSSVEEEMEKAKHCIISVICGTLSGEEANS